MKGSCISNPMKHLALAPLSGAAAMVLAAYPAQPGASVGPPITPSPGAAWSPAAASPTHVAVVLPGRHSAAPARRIPLGATPLIPPAAMWAQLNLLPEPRPVLSLEPELEAHSPAFLPTSSAAKLPSS